MSAPAFAPNERRALDGIAARLPAIRAAAESVVGIDPNYIPESFRGLEHLRRTIGNLSNDLSVLASLMAKVFLSNEVGTADYDACAKPPGAAGLDIDVATSDGARVVGEIKTTVPLFGARAFGAQQETLIRKDLKRLAAVAADRRFMFVTDDEAFSILIRARFEAIGRGVEVVNLLSGQRHHFP